MRVMQSDFAALNAEQYDDGNITRRLPPPDAPRGRVPAEGWRRKRPRMETQAIQRPSLDEDAGEDAGPMAGDPEEDGKKRARGRPRLDTTDQTAADRRRTQIRLAQRAYRNRKEESIQSLEKKVQDLTNTNSEINNALTKLYEFVAQKGVLEPTHPLNQELRAATEKIRDLAQRSDGDSGESTSVHATSTSSSAPRTRRKSGASELPRQTPSTAMPAHERPVHSWGGYVVTHQLVTEPDPSETLYSDSFSSVPSMARPGQDLETVTYPTFENASFPFNVTNDMGQQSSFSGLNFGSDPTFVQLPPPPAAAPSLSALPSLPLPDTFAYSEVTFGRRLQRCTNERALVLASSPNPHPHKLARVFGFCMLFEPIESIRERLHFVVTRNRNETLDFWQYPFVHLNAAGTHFPQDASAAATGGPNHHHLMGNQGTLQALRPQDGTGFSTGPFVAHFSHARDTHVTPHMRIRVPGFEEDFYDCEELEILLHQRGVSIPVGADQVYAEIDVSMFEDEVNTCSIPDPTQMLSESSVFVGRPDGGGSRDSSRTYSINHRPGGSGRGGSYSTLQQGDTSSLLSSGLLAGGADVYSTMFEGPISITYNGAPGAPSLDQSAAAAMLPPPQPIGTFGGDSSRMNPGVAVGGAAGGMMTSSYPPVPTTAAGEGWNAAMPAPVTGMMAPLGGGQSDRVREKKTVMICLNVHLFIEELIKRTRCLGRSPSFRLKDIYSAFWAAARSGRS